MSGAPIPLVIPLWIGYAKGWRGDVAPANEKPQRIEAERDDDPDQRDGGAEGHEHDAGQRHRARGHELRPAHRREGGRLLGLNYVLDIVAEPNANDRTFELHGVRLYCDPKSYLYLNGTLVDYEQTTMGGGFKFSNPNAKRSCGCGTSFAV